MSETEENGTPRFGVFDSAGLYVRGFLMGAADIVPGVSGGTIALVTGIYERFVNALGSLSPSFLVKLVKGDVKGSVKSFWGMHWAVLVPLFAGILTAVVLMSTLITGLMHDRPGMMFAFFFGLILCSAWAPFSRMKTRGVVHVVAALLGAVAAWVIVGVQPSGLDVEVRPGQGMVSNFIYSGDVESEEHFHAILDAAHRKVSHAHVVIYDPDKDLTSISDTMNATLIQGQEELVAWADSVPTFAVIEVPRAQLWWVFVCGAVSISAMILPGLSGSFLMLLLGQYHAVTSTISRMPEHVRVLLGAEADPLLALSGHTLTQDTVFLGVFACGVGLGLMTFSRVVQWLFDHWHDATLAVLTGLMLGALRLPGSKILEHAGEGGESWGVLSVAAVVGAVLVTGLTIYDARSGKSAS